MLAKLNQNPAIQRMASVGQNERSSIDMRTFVLLTEPNREGRVRNHLKDALKLNPYLPLEHKTRYRTIQTMFGVQRRPYESHEPIFRGYIFVPLNLAWSFGPLHTTPGLRHGCPFLRINGRLVTLNDADFQDLVRAEYELAHATVPGLPYEIGERVKVVNGPFSDRVGEIARMDSAERIELLMDVLGKLIVSASDIAKEA